MISVTIVGRLGTDPQVRITPEGKKVTSLNLATSVGFGDKKKTVWWKASVWGDRFDKLMPYIKKGGQIGVTGTLSREPNIFTGADGVAKVSSLEITADAINLIGGDKKEEGAAPSKPIAPASREPQYASTQNFDDSELPF